MDDLKRLYTLFERVDSLDSVDAAFTSYVKYAGDYLLQLALRDRRTNDSRFLTGMEIVGDTEGDSSMVEKILEFKDQIDAIVSEVLCVSP